MQKSAKRHNFHANYLSWDNALPLGIVLHESVSECTRKRVRVYAKACPSVRDFLW